MNKSTVLALATAASALATAAISIADELGEDTGAETGGAPEAPAKRRGRPPGGGAAPAEQPAAPAGKTVDELKVVIKPMIENDQGDEVKKLIAKHASPGGTKLSDIPVANQAAFIKDVEASSY